MTREELIKATEEVNEMFAKVLNNSPEFMQVWTAAGKEEQDKFRQIAISSIANALIG